MTRKQNGPPYAITADAVRDALALASRAVRRAEDDWRRAVEHYRPGSSDLWPALPSVALCLEAQEAAAAAATLTYLAGDWDGSKRWHDLRVVWARRALAVVASQPRPYPPDPPPWLQC